MLAAVFLWFSGGSILLWFWFKSVLVFVVVYRGFVCFGFAVFRF